MWEVFSWMRVVESKATIFENFAFAEIIKLLDCEGWKKKEGHERYQKRQWLTWNNEGKKTRKFAYLKFIIHFRPFISILSPNKIKFAKTWLIIELFRQKFDHFQKVIKLGKHRHWHRKYFLVCSSFDTSLRQN